MKNAFVLEDFLNFDNYIDDFVEQAPIIQKSISTTLYIFGNKGDELLLTSHIKGNEQCEINHLKTWFVLHAYSSLNDHIVCSITEGDGEKASVINISIINPIMEEWRLIASLIIYVEKVNYSLLPKSELNYFYFENLCHHIQMVIINYEKLYYIIDVYTELLISKDRYMPYHMTNVANWCMGIATELELSPKEQMNLYIAALIHDIGKLFIPDYIINKPSGLDTSEVNLVRLHPIKSYQIAQSALYGMSLFDMVPKIIRHHHERYDGTGYPDKLLGEEIPLLSRILTVADTVDAMMSRRAYKEKSSHDLVISELQKYSGKQFDPKIAQVMIGRIADLNRQKDGESIANTNFIAQASLSFTYRDQGRINTYTGNLIVNQDIGKFLVHSHYDTLDHLDIDKIYKSTISYFKMDDFIEYSVDIDGILGNQVFISSFKYVPIDKYFSISWDGFADISHPATGVQNVKMVKLGGDTLIFESAGSSAELICKFSGEVFALYFETQIDEQTFKLEVDLRIVKTYEFLHNTIYIGKFVEMPNSLRDKLIRILFRKQIAVKRVAHHASLVSST